VSVLVDNVYMIWFEDVSGGNKCEVFLKASNDDGKTFGNIINLNNSALDMCLHFRFYYYQRMKHTYFCQRECFTSMRLIRMRSMSLVFIIVL
jgi:hypothetical protein